MKVITIILMLLSLVLAKGAVYKDKLSYPYMLHCSSRGSQSVVWNHPGEVFLYDTDTSHVGEELYIRGPYGRHPSILGNNGETLLEVLGTFSQHSLGSRQDNVPYQLVQWGERVGDKSLDDRQRLNLVVWEPTLRHLRYVKTMDHLTFVYVYTCEELYK